MTEEEHEISLTGSACSEICFQPYPARNDARTEVDSW